MRFKKFFSVGLGLATLAVVLVSCNHSESATVSVGSESPAPANIEAPTSFGILPAVKVIRPVAETQHYLVDLVDPAKPTLIWFWAPYCPSCRNESPSIEALAQRNLDNFTVLGLGTMNDLAQAKDFENLIDFNAVELVWDESGESWKPLGAWIQTSWMLLDAQGNELIPFKLGRPNETIILKKIGVEA